MVVNNKMSPYSTPFNKLPHRALNTWRLFDLFFWPHLPVCVSITYFPCKVETEEAETLGKSNFTPDLLQSCYYQIRKQWAAWRLTYTNHFKQSSCWYQVPAILKLYICSFSLWENPSNIIIMHVLSSFLLATSGWWNAGGKMAQLVLKAWPCLFVLNLNIIFSLYYNCHSSHYCV